MVYGGILKTTRRLSHLDVAVYDALRVDEAEGREQVEGHLDDLELADAAAGARPYPLGEAAPLQQLQDHAKEPTAVQHLAGRKRRGLRGITWTPLASSYAPPHRLHKNI